MLLNEKKIKEKLKDFLLLCIWNDFTSIVYVLCYSLDPDSSLG